MEDNTALLPGTLTQVTTSRSWGWASLRFPCGAEWAVAAATESEPTSLTPIEASACSRCLGRDHSPEQLAYLMGRSSLVTGAECVSSHVSHLPPAVIASAALSQGPGEARLWAGRGMGT